MSHPRFTGADRRLVGDLRQLASVRRITLDDGEERGLRALVFSTGGGLDFWALADRALDIGPLWWRGLPLAWVGPLGFRGPSRFDAESEGGQGFARMLSGLVCTGGLDHIRQPLGPHPLHGRFAFTPATIRAYGEDWERDEPVLFCEGEASQAVRGGASLRLHRRIEAPVSGTVLRIVDTVENIGAETVPQALLYHCNLGYPAIGTGTVVTSAGEVLLGPVVGPDADAVQMVHSRAVAEGACEVRTPVAGVGMLSVRFRFDAGTLPHLQWMHDLRPHAMLVAIEPCTSARLEGGRSGPETKLGPGERRSYRLEIGVSCSADDLA